MKMGSRREGMALVIGPSHQRRAEGRSSLKQSHVGRLPQEEELVVTLMLRKKGAGPW